jgi:calcineurin-like phosphoesterase family protein
MSLWFTSDQHFGHGKVSELCARPFSSVEEMNEVLVHRFNECVKPADTTYHLGDFSFLKVPISQKLLAQLNGEHILILGNHDRSMKSMLSIGFTQVHYNLTRSIQGVDVFMRHVPPASLRSCDARDFKPKFMVEPGPHDLFLCGHVHEKWRRRGNVVNVGVDQWDYAPVSLDEILGLMGT